MKSFHKYFLNPKRDIFSKANLHDQINQLEKAQSRRERIMQHRNIVNSMSLQKKATITDIKKFKVDQTASKDSDETPVKLPRKGQVTS